MRCSLPTLLAKETLYKPKRPKICVPFANASKLIKLKTLQRKQSYKVKQSIQPSESSLKLQTVNINTATEAELDTLPGIGPAIAKRIITFRKQQAFTKPEDIMLVKGIGKKKFAKLRERITVE